MYNVNIDFFKDIDTENKAYWLGFLYADGCILEQHKKDKTSLVLELALKYEDISHIEKFKKDIGSNAPIKTKMVNLNGKTYKACRISICSTSFCKNLVKNGCVPRKSNILKFPEFLDKDMYKHFIRGYFDGDGCIWSGKKYHNIRNKSYDAYSINFVGTLDMLTCINNFCISFGMNKVKKIQKGRAYQMFFGGRKQVINFYNHIYKDSSIYLNRKYNHFLEIIAPCSSNTTMKIGEYR